MSKADSVGRSPPTGADPTPTSPKKVIFDKYELGRLLGCGAFAKVYHARDLSSPNHRSVAIKIIPKSRISKHHNLARGITREVSILRRLRHPNIVRLYEVLASRTKIFFVLEFAKGGELFARISKLGRLPEDLARRYFQQLISAVGYCHYRGVFHRDLKPENLLLDDHGDLKVSDFGLSALSDQIRPDGRFHTLCGTPAYVAPEILAKKGYDGAKVDVWSCGVILYVLNAGYLPFNDSNLMNLYRKIYCGEYRIPKWTSPELRRLISKILDTNPDTRMTLDEITRDPWFRKGLDSKKLAALMKFHDDDDDEKEEECEERELNAFDLISFSSGVNLSGLFESAVDRERFVSRETVEGILERAEEVGRSERCFVVRKGQNGVVVRGRTGDFAARVRAHKLTGGATLVETSVGRDGWAREFWRDKLGPALRGSDWRPPAEGTSADRPEASS